MSYTALKTIHVLAAIISICGFTLRGLWMLNGSALLQQRWVKITPHIIDTILLVSAIALVIWSHQHPGQMAWLSTKIVALVLYIGFGMVALKRGPTLRIRAVAFAAALLTFAYIVAVATTRDLTPFI